MRQGAPLLIAGDETTPPGLQRIRGDATLHREREREREMSRDITPTQICCTAHGCTLQGDETAHHTADGLRRDESTETPPQYSTTQHERRHNRPDHTASLHDM